MQTRSNFPPKICCFQQKVDRLWQQAPTLHLSYHMTIPPLQRISYQWKQEDDAVLQVFPPKRCVQNCLWLIWSIPDKDSGLSCSASIDHTNESSQEHKSVTFFTWQHLRQHSPAAGSKSIHFEWIHQHASKLRWQPLGLWDQACASWNWHQIFPNVSGKLLFPSHTPPRIFVHSNFCCYFGLFPFWMWQQFHESLKKV